MNIAVLVMHSFLVVFDVFLMITNWRNGSEISSVLWGIAGIIWFILLIMDIFNIRGGK